VAVRKTGDVCPIGCREITVSRDETVVVNSGAKRKTCARGWGNPPEFPHPGMVAGHHAMAQVVHHSGAHLGGCVNRIGIGKRAQEWVPLGVAIRNGASR